MQPDGEAGPCLWGLQTHLGVHSGEVVPLLGQVDDLEENKGREP